MCDPNTITLQQWVDRLLQEAELGLSPPSRCPYLPDREDQVEYFCTEKLSPAVYETLMDRGFRRNGGIVYRPVCPGCGECRQLRVPVWDFRPSRSMRRVWRRNHDVTIEVGPLEPTAQKWQLFHRYLTRRHDRTMTGSLEEFHHFLYTSPVATLEVRYYRGRHLVGVSLLDRGPRSLSSVYMFFDPDHGEYSPGTFSILWEITYCRRVGIPYYYLGFYVPDCPTMAYKARYGPCETLHEHRHWTRVPEFGTPECGT